MQIGSPSSDSLKKCCATPPPTLLLTLQAKSSQITKVFEDAYRSPQSLIILDDIERLLEYVAIGPRFSNIILQTLLVLIKKVPTPGHKLVVIGTTSQGDVVESMGLSESLGECGVWHCRGELWPR